MVVLSAGTLISNCCHALAVCVEGSDTDYQCTQCTKICTASESLGEYHDRLEAPKRERERLKDAVVEAAKEWREMLYMQAGTSRSRAELMKAVDALKKFEAENKVE